MLRCGYAERRVRLVLAAVGTTFVVYLIYAALEANDLRNRQPRALPS